mgnify:CR=1 FL=1|tara:strand:+ start:63 stop:1946 length:1884 start_codon:yes stop_codon:yes gene_type:complete
MAFKMNGWSAGKGTGSHSALTKKTVFKKDPPEVELNQGPELYTGGNPFGEGHLNMDDPMTNQMLYPDKVSSWVNLPEGTGPGANLHSQYEENVYKRDNENSKVKKGVSGNIAKRINEEDQVHHEQYEGIKDGGAGYSDMMLGVQNNQEKAWQEQFENLEDRLEEYMGNFHKSLNPKDAPAFWPGDGVTDNLTLDRSDPRYYKQYEEWSKRQGNEKRKGESDIAHQQRMNIDVENVLNLDNDLKMAAEVGYHLDPDVMEKYQLHDDEVYKPTQKSEQLKATHIENKKLRKESLQTRKSDKAYNKFLSLMEDDGLSAGEAAKQLYKSDIDAIMGLTSASTGSSTLYQGETGSILNNSDLFRQALADDQVDYTKNKSWKKGKVINPAHKPWDEDRWGTNPHDSSQWNAEQGMSHEDYEAKQDVDYQASLIDQQNQKAAAVDAETQWYNTPEGQDYLNDVPGAPSYEEFQQGQTGGGYQPQTTGGTEDMSDNVWDDSDTQDLSNISDAEEKNKEKINESMGDDEGYTPQSVNENVEEYTPQSINEDVDDDEESEESYVEDAEGNYIPQGARNRKEYTPQSAMNKNVNSPLDYSKPNPFNYGSDDYYGFQKKARSHKLGLAKRIFNIYSKDA